PAPRLPPPWPDRGRRGYAGTPHTGGDPGGTRPVSSRPGPARPSATSRARRADGRARPASWHAAGSVGHTLVLARQQSACEQQADDALRVHELAPGDQGVDVGERDLL